MLQNTAVCPAHEYTNICVWMCEALPNRALRRVNFLLLSILHNLTRVLTITLKLSILTRFSNSPEIYIVSSSVTDTQNQF